MLVSEQCLDMLRGHSFLDRGRDSVADLVRSESFDASFRAVSGQRRARVAIRGHGQVSAFVVGVFAFQFLQVQSSGCRDDGRGESGLSDPKTQNARKRSILMR